jgi:hypothetical protein
VLLPLLAVAMRALINMMAPPGSWQLFMDEVRRYLVGELGMVEDDTLDTVLTVQRVLLLAGGSTFPLDVALKHDYAEWHRQVLDAREAGHRDDWEQVVPPLRTFGPATFTVDDPEDICRRAVGGNLVALTFSYGNTELDSPVARPTIATRAERAEAPTTL